LHYILIPKSLILCVVFGSISRPPVPHQNTTCWIVYV
jgi:hypothetical protein